MDTAKSNQKVKSRSYGEGSVYRRKDGRWVAKYRDDTMSKPRYLYGKTESEVKRKLRELKRDAARGIAECKKIFFSEYAERWLYMFKLTSVEPSSFDHYEMIYKNHIKPVLGDYQLGSIRASDIQNLINKKSRDYSYPIVKKIRSLLAEIFQYAYTESDIVKNPVDNVILPKKGLFKPSKDILVLEDEEVRRLEEVAKMQTKAGHPVLTHADLMVFIVHTGLRCGEVLALKWSDIDFSKRTVTVSKNLTRIKEREQGKSIHKRMNYVKGTKTESGKRVVPLNSKAVEALKHLQAIYKEYGITSSNVASSKNNTTLNNARMHRLLERMLKHAHIDKPLTIHQLRHTFATRALKAGVAISVVSKWMGHANISTTYNTYIHVLESERAEAETLLEAM